MMFRTHLAIGILSSILINDYFHTGLLFSIVLVMSTSLPDIDHQGSWIGRRLWIFSRPINLIFGHRGITHSIIIPILIFIVASYYGYMPLGFAAMIGYTSHIVSDSFTNEGVKIGYPFSGKIYSGPLKTNGLGEKALFLMIILAIFVKIV